jgi:hypothetical protein
MPLGAFEVQLAGAQPVGALFDAAQQRDCEVRDVNGDVVLGAGSMECRQGEVVGNEVPRSLIVPVVGSFFPSRKSLEKSLCRQLWVSSFLVGEERSRFTHSRCNDNLFSLHFFLFNFISLQRAEHHQLHLNSNTTDNLERDRWVQAHGNLRLSHFFRHREAGVYGVLKFRHGCNSPFLGRRYLKFHVLESQNRSDGGHFSRSRKNFDRAS